MITLAIETSTPHGSVALLDGETLLAEEHFIGDRSHSASLFVALEKLRALVERVDQIAVGLGPGSYAGVRIAIAAALGLRLAMHARWVGLPSVAALDVPEPAYIVIGDARRDSFYFTRIENGVCTEGPLLATETELRARLTATAASPSTGTASTTATTPLPVYATEPVPQFPAARVALPAAIRLAHLAATARGITATEHLEPIYLREPHITQPKVRPGISRL